MDKIYCDLMLFASGVVATLSLVLACIPIPDSKNFNKLKAARATLAVSFVNFISFLTGYDAALDRLNTLIVASLQALLMTGTLLVFIRPDVVRWRWVAVQVAVISAVSGLLYALMYLCPAVYGAAFIVAAVLFVLQMALYTVWFFRSLNRTLQETNAYYAEECSPRLNWIRNWFILVLQIGVASIVMLFAGPWFNLVFVPAYLICYTFAAICMLRYVGKISFILPAIRQPEEPAAKCRKAQISESDAVWLRERIGVWVNEKKYVKVDVPYKDILDELGTDAATMRAFMKSEYGMDFRTWRNRLRLDEACRLLQEHPEMKAEQISRMVGYSDSSNFHTDFKRLMGMSVGEWRKSVQVSC